MARLTALPLLMLLAACRSGDAPEASASGDGQPTAVSEDGVALYVERVNRRGDGAEVVFTVVNPTDRAIRVSQRHDPIVLQGAERGTLTGPEERIEVASHSRDRVTVPLAGEADGALTLRTNAKSGGPSSPALTVSIPADGRFGAVTRAAVTPQSASVNHANGTSVTVQRVAFGPETVDVDVLVVNGHRNGIELNNSGAYLTDDAGRRYGLIPPAANDDLSVPEGGSLRGTLRFGGRVPAGVRTLTLTFNGRFGGDHDFSNQPKIVVPNLSLAP